MWSHSSFKELSSKGRSQNSTSLQAVPPVTTAPNIFHCLLHAGKEGGAVLDEQVSSNSTAFPTPPCPVFQQPLPHPSPTHCLQINKLSQAAKSGSAKMRQDFENELRKLNQQQQQQQTKR